jgi:hypothetical protein
MFLQLQTLSSIVKHCDVGNLSRAVLLIQKAYFILAEENLLSF